MQASANMSVKKAVKFNELVFDQAKAGEYRKRPLVNGDCNFCATDPFAYEVTKDEFKVITK